MLYAKFSSSVGACDEIFALLRLTLHPRVLRVCRIVVGCPIAEGFYV